MIRRSTACALGLGLTGIVAWTGTATWLVAARDSGAAGLFARDTERLYAYEDRIRALQTELERAVTLNLVERTRVGARLDGLAQRQAEIEGRQGWLKRVAERLPGSATASDRDLATGSLGRTLEVPSGPPFTLRLRETSPAAPVPSDERPRDRLSALENSLQNVAEAEISTIGVLQTRAQTRLARVRGVLASIGLDVPRATPAASTGGPLVPVAPAAAAGAFGPLAAELDGTFAELDRALASARGVPLGRPLSGDLELTSSFGYRFDPFTRAPALHTGNDYRAEYGAPVRATAAGRVGAADWGGGYGNMVEIDHGGGIVTRYGHLSAFAVSLGERVEAGAVIGYAGSTGRSTGTHVHYETRVNGEPVNPTRFLEAGAQLAALR